MRTRNLTSTGVPDTIVSRLQTTNWTNPAFPDQIFQDSVDFGSQPYTELSATISDVVSEAPIVSVDPLTGSWKRIRYQSSKGSSTGLRPSKPCDHTRVKVSLEKGLSVVFSGYEDFGSPLHERFHSIAYNHPTSATLLRQIVPFLGDLDSVLLADTSSLYTVGDYKKHDWFSLMARFDEACDQFIPSSFLVGEDIAQHQIFSDAFKLVLNPTRALKVFVDLLALRFKGKSRNRSLGELVRSLSKDVANTNLFYQFGVKPAIADLKLVLNAHQKVSSRLKFLRLNSGRFVPVRVRTQLASDFENPPLELTGELDIQWQIESKISTAVIGSWGRVRDDLNFGDTWSAYLQYFGINKMAGLAWELIPFSFVLDWFTNAQERINYYTRLRTGGPFTEFTGLWSSEKQEFTEKLYCLPGYSEPDDKPMTSPDSPFCIATRVATHYVRSTSIPDVSGVVDLSTLGLFQFLTAGSLIVQRY